MSKSSSVGSKIDAGRSGEVLSFSGSHGKRDATGTRALPNFRWVDTRYSAVSHWLRIGRMIPARTESRRARAAARRTLVTESHQACFPWTLNESGARRTGGIATFGSESRPLTELYLKDCSTLNGTRMKLAEPDPSAVR